MLVLARTIRCCGLSLRVIFMSARMDMAKYDNTGCHCAYARSGVNSSGNNMAAQHPLLFLKVVDVVN